jgi:hypothetical protein
MDLTRSHFFSRSQCHTSLSPPPLSLSHGQCGDARVAATHGDARAAVTKAHGSHRWPQSMEVTASGHIDDHGGGELRSGPDGLYLGSGCFFWNWLLPAAHIRNHIEKWYLYKRFIDRLKKWLIFTRVYFVSFLEPHGKAPHGKVLLGPLKKLIWE